MKINTANTRIDRIILVALIVFSRKKSTFFFKIEMRIAKTIIVFTLNYYKKNCTILHASNCR